MTSEPIQPIAHKAPESQIDSLLATAPHVINIGLEQFAIDLQDQGADVIHVDWSPPAGGDAALRSLLSKLGS